MAHFRNSNDFMYLLYFFIRHVTLTGERFHYEPFVAHESMIKLSKPVDLNLWANIALRFRQVWTMPRDLDRFGQCPVIYTGLDNAKIAQTCRFKSLGNVYALQKRPFSQGIRIYYVYF